MSMTATASVRDTVKAIRDKLRRKIGQTKVKQYWPDKVPKRGADDDDEENEDDAADDGDNHDDEVNEAEEYEAFKVREMGRIKRDREAMLKEKEQEVKKVRRMNMTEEEERRGWEWKNPKPAAAPPPKKQKEQRFIQKYYHKGAFLQSDPDDPAATIGTHSDFSAPTGEDRMDRTILPKVMQVKHFGRSGRTKWTHLVNQDTTDWNNPWTYNDPLRAKYNDKMAAMNAPIAKPKGSRKLKYWESR